MSLLTVVQDVFLLIGVNAPTSVIGSTNLSVKKAKAILDRHVGDDLMEQVQWPELSKEHVFVTASSTASYALPSDFLEFIHSTQWDRTGVEPLIGPLSGEEWQERKSGITSTGACDNFRVKGCTTTQFFVDPTPTTVSTLAFEYQSKVWFAPKTWATGQVYTADQYTFYNGNFYKTTAGGTTASSAPVHTTGDVSDGGVTWTYQTAAYTSLLTDDDQFLLDEGLVTLGLEWRLRRELGLPYSHTFTDYTEAIKRKASNLRGARTLNMGGVFSGTRLLNVFNMAETGLG